MGEPPRAVLVAAFPLRGGGAACLQLHDEEGLRRGGVYLLAVDDPGAPARAPRFDELFGDLAAKLRADPALRPPLLALLARARAAARAARPRLEPAALDELAAVLAAAADLDAGAGAPPSGFTLEELVASCLLIFVSEEERYPRPRYQGADLAWERLVSAVGVGQHEHG